MNRVTTLFLFVTTLLVMVPAIHGSAAPDAETLAVNDPRPVAKAIEELEARYGVVITYEDPVYEFAGDLVNVAAKVRADYDPARPHAAKPVLIPRGGELRVALPRAANLGKPDAARLAEAVCAPTLKGDAAARFGVKGAGDVQHVVPLAARNAQGERAPAASPLDAVVNLPSADRTGLESLEALFALIESQTGAKVVPGTMPLNLMLNGRVRFGCEGCTAREAALEILRGLGGRLSWQLFYDANEKYHVFNVHSVAVQPAP